MISKHRLLILSLQVFIAAGVLAVGVTFWYFVMGRKPSLVLSARFESKSGPPVGHIVGNNELLVVAADKATLYELSSGKEKWTATLTAAPKTPAIDPRIQRLQKWAEELSAKRANLKTPEEIAAFNV